MSKLFTPASIGAIDLRHRIVHAPTTRLRSLPDETPSPMMLDYYRQRASQGGPRTTAAAISARLASTRTPMSRAGGGSPTPSTPRAAKSSCKSPTTAGRAIST
jgi:2,4-dienoyl-CoA reductase-like NADH-dependent reductase (Old Yellow Enzyme family)